MRIPSLEPRARLQAAYRDAMAEWARADDSGDEERISAARGRVGDAVQALRADGVDPVRGRLP